MYYFKAKISLIGLCLDHFLLFILRRVKEVCFMDEANRGLIVHEIWGRLSLSSPLRYCFDGPATSSLEPNSICLEDKNLSCFAHTHTHTHTHKFTHSLSLSLQRKRKHTRPPTSFFWCASLCGCVCVCACVRVCACL